MSVKVRGPELHFSGRAQTSWNPRAVGMNQPAAIFTEEVVPHQSSRVAAEATTPLLTPDHMKASVICVEALALGEVTAQVVEMLGLN